MAPAPSAPAIPTSFGHGRYLVERFLGEGGKKCVFLAHDTRLDRDVAVALIKTEGLDEAGRLRVQREAQAMARLGDHPHIVTVFDIGDEAGQPYITSQYMAGGDVATLLRNADQHRLALDLALRITADVCAALEHAHQQGVIHRDLKPENIWLTEDGTAKLGDFGLAVALDRSRLTQDGMLVGTVAYLPPEQALGRPPDPRSDLYALGALLYEMLTGRPPFLGDDAVAVISQHINTAPVAPSWHNPAVPAALEALVLRLLSKTPEERPASAAAVSEWLATVAATLTEEPTLSRGALAPANPLDRLAGGVFVGRDEAMRELRAGLDEAFSGRGRLLLLVGEPGIGKTRTAEELATYARLRSAHVLIGRCYEGEGAPAYWPWVQILRAYVHDRDTTALQAEMGSGAVDIAQLVSEVRERLPDVLPPIAEPDAARFRLFDSITTFLKNAANPKPLIAQIVSEVRERLPDVLGPPIVDADQARFRLFDSITTFLKNAADGKPLVLIVDDLQWADRPSLRLLQFLARELRSSRVLVVATYRDVDVRRHHPLSQTLGELAREQLGQRIMLRGITASDVARFITMTAGKAPSDALVAAVYRETEGNPFFVSEIVRLLVADGRLEQWEEGGAGSVGIPQSVREVIGRRLDRLSERCNRVLTTAAVVGRDFGLSALERVSDLAADQLLEVLEEAVAARIITEGPRGLGRYGFSHALIRETLYGELTTTRRVRLHRRIGEVLERLYASDLEPHLAELAYHFFEAAPGGDLARAIEYATRAGERATALLAYEEAAGHFEHALQALELQEPPDPRLRCELLLALGEAQIKAGEPVRAKDVFRQAAEVARKLRAPEELARAALGHGAMWMTTGVVDTDLVNLLEEALGALGTEDSPVRARVLARLAVELYWSAARDRGAGLAQEAEAIARRIGDPAALAFALTAKQIVKWGQESAAELLSPAEEIVRLAAAAGDRSLVSMGREWRVVGLLARGDIRAADREIEAQARLAEELRQPILRWVVDTWRTMRALMAGRFEDAEALAHQALVLGRRVKPAEAAQSFAVQMLFLRREQGRLPELEVTIRALVDQYPGLPAWRCAQAYFYSELGRYAEARREFEQLAAHDFADFPVDMLWLIAMVILSEVCATLHDTRRAATLYQLLLPYAGRNILAGTATVCVGAASRTLGVLAATMARWSDAERHFDEALAMHASMEAAPLLAYTQREYADMLLARDQPGDRERARGLANEALNTAQHLGMTMLVERATALKLRAQGVDAEGRPASIDAVASSVQRQRPDLRGHVASDGTVTLMFSDMEGFTVMTERLGDREAHRIIRVHNAIVRQQLAAYGGAELELQGDGFLLAFADACQGVRCAIAIQRAFATYNQAHPEQPIRVRIGLHTGAAIAETDRFFGKTVILAARIAAQAGGGEILASAMLRDLTAASGIRFGRSREATLKGLAGIYTLHSVDWTREAC